MLLALSRGPLRAFVQHHVNPVSRPCKPSARLFGASTLVQAQYAPVIAIKAEDPKRLWERRAPLVPRDMASIVSQGAQVVVQSCEKRVFPDHAYEQAGARIVDRIDPSTAQLVLGIKEIPIHDIAPDTTYAFFSHTHKGQAYNMPLLSAMLASKQSRFIDWELLTDDQGVRTTAFGWQAGFAGMADGLSQFATKALARGFATPFLTLPRPFMVPSIEALRTNLRRVGQEIAERGLPASMGPLVIVISGKGRVGQGAKSVLDDLPTRWIKAADLERVARGSDIDRRKIYACQLELADYLEHVDGKPFDREEYRRNPQLFTSTFHEKIAPHATVLLNGSFWSNGSPRLLTNVQLADLQRSASNRLLSIVDVSCDFDGALEFVKSATTIDDPVIQYDAHAEHFHRDASDKKSTQISSIEILPSELPFDSSIHFSKSILPYVQALLRDPHLRRQDDRARALRRATIVHDCKLMAEHEHLGALLAKRLKKRKKVVVLGSGLVAGPAVRVLASRSDLDVILASDNLAQASSMAAPYSTVSAKAFDMSDETGLHELIGGASAVLSLLPAPFHVEIAKACIKSKAHLVTASYVSSDMASLDNQAQEAGVILLNELGLDPGIDHASAMSMIEEAKKAGRKIESFISFCGGLPSPELSDSPLGYRFSWSPRGVLTAASNDARFRIAGRQIDISGRELLGSVLPSVPLIRGFAFEGLANRDSTKYIQEYELPADIATVMRGTLRYPGYSNVLLAFQQMGLCSTEELECPLKSWDGLIDACMNRILGDNSIESIKDRINAMEKLVKDRQRTGHVIDDNGRLGLWSSSTAQDMPACPKRAMSPLDLLSTLLAHKLRYNEGERDLVVLKHELVTSDSKGNRELSTSTLVQYGQPNGDSAMATTVGVPAALGVLLCVDGKAGKGGLLTPTSELVWRPLLAALEEHGIHLVGRKEKGKIGVAHQIEQQLLK